MTRKHRDYYEVLRVTVPAGAEEGMALRIPGHGLPSDEPDGETGDINLRLRKVAKDKAK